MILNEENAVTIEDKDAYITYLQDENKRLMQLVETLISNANEKEERETAERKRIQAKGIAKAKKEGIRFGRPPKPLPDKFHAAYMQWKAGEISMSEAARRAGMPDGTFRYRAKSYEK